MPDPEIARWKVEPLDRPRRGPEERIALAAPWVGRRLLRLAASEPAGSRRRRAMLTRAVRVSIAANNRGDYQAMMANYHPDIELIPPGRGMAGIGFEAVYRGHEGVRQFIEQWKSGFAHHVYEPREIADPGGERFALRFGLRGTMRDSEAQIEDEYGVVITLEDGFVVRQENHYDWNDALSALTA